jgi:neurofibromin 1
MMRCLKRAVPLLTPDSRYAGGTTFWLGIAILQIDHQAMFGPGLELLAATLASMDKEGFFANDRFSDVMLAYRTDETQCKLDQIAGVAFDTSFSFSLVALLFKGLHRPAWRDQTIALLQHCLQLETHSEADAVGSLAYILALSAVGAPLKSQSGAAVLTSIGVRREDLPVDSL